MSNYKGHCSINLALALPLLLLAGYYFLHPRLDWCLTFSACFIYGTLFMSPDADVAEKVKLFSVRGFFSLPFRSYSRFFRHRGLSHSIIVGTLTRVLWLCLWGLVIFVGFYQALPSTEPIMKYVLIKKWYFIYGFAGLFTADLSHILVDKVV